MNLRSGRRRNPFGVGIGWLTAWRDTLCCLMTATVVVEHRHRGGDRAQAQDGDYPHGLAPNRHWCLSKYCSHAAERILAACSMLP